MNFPKAWVRVSDKIAEFGGKYIDSTQPDEPRIIDAEAREVYITSLVSGLILRKEVVVEEKRSNKKNKESWPNELRADITKLLDEYDILPSKLASLSDESMLALKGITANKLREIRKLFPVNEDVNNSE